MNDHQDVNKTKRPLRIAVVAACPFPTSQGSQVLIRQSCEALQQRGHEVHLVTYHFGEFERQLPFAIHRLPNLLPYKKLRAGPSLRKPILDALLTATLCRTIQTYNLQIIHAHNYEAALAGYLARKRFRIPVIYHSHNVMGDELPTYFQRSASKRYAQHFADFLDRHIPSAADHVIALTRQIEKYLLQHQVNPKNISVIPPGTVPDEFTRCNINKIKNDFNLSAKHTLIYTGNLDNYQNLELLFAGLKQVAQNLEDVELLLVSHSDPNEIKYLWQECGVRQFVRCIKTNSFQTVVDLLATADVAVIPRTTWSGFPIKLLNYMAGKKAVVASAGSAKGIVHGYNGWIVANRNVTSMASGIRTLLNQPELRKILGENAYQHVSIHHNWGQLILKIESIYYQLLDKAKINNTNFQQDLCS